jgi:paraquat-inducible protein A
MSVLGCHAEDAYLPLLGSQHVSFPSWIICEHCNCVYKKIALNTRQIARCARCAAVLARGNRLSLQQHLALTLTAALCFVCANIFPVLSINLQGLSNEATLAHSIIALLQGPMSVIAVVAAITIIGAPLLQILGLCWVLIFALRRQAAPGFKPCMRMLEWLRPWSMLEVALLGVLVALIKLAGMLDVHPGLGLWGLAMLSVLIILISGTDIRRLWDDLERQPR